MTLESWGRCHSSKPAQVIRLSDRHAALPLDRRMGRLLAHGLGRSYGDVALSEQGTLLHTVGLDRFIAWDRATGVLRTEAGVSLDDILRMVVPQGWFLAVTPGTRYVTLGGAVANDVHGKNHHRAGTFGCHVRAFELLRSDGSRLLCTPHENADWFAATIGGCGLTGLITWVEIQLVPVANPWVTTINRKFGSLNEYWELDADLGQRSEYAVAWVDCLGPGRGIYTAGDHSPPQATLPIHRSAERSFPIDPPISLINSLSLRAFNLAYYSRPVPSEALMHYEPFFYPLDAISRWNRIYGRAGFYQYQCVLPPANMRESSAELFKRLASCRQGSFLAVFKTFGARPSPGLISFPRPGVTLALDFPNRGESTHRLFSALDAVVSDAGGATYSAKDGRARGAFFRSGYPRFDAFSKFVDPAFSSDFWKRVNGD
jgi:FAD/FMN-containing dehydrogenase